MDASGHLIIVSILACLVAAVGASLVLRRRYHVISQELFHNADQHKPFTHPVLNAVVKEARLALLRTREINAQAIVEQQFQSELKRMLIAERFVRSSTGLMIILGLVGTFYGLTLSIGKLVVLVSNDGPALGDITQTLSRGLTDALSGMSVAFSTSLFGVVAAIVMMLLGVANNVTDQRTALMVQIENFLEHVLRTEPLGPGEVRSALGDDSTQRLQQIVKGLSDSISMLDAALMRFDSSLQGFAATTRDFREFNLHLKDNVQRMSLSFGDLSETIRSHVDALKAHERRDQ